MSLSKNNRFRKRVIILSMIPIAVVGLVITNFIVQANKTRIVNHPDKSYSSETLEMGELDTGNTTVRSFDKPQGEFIYEEDSTPSVIGNYGNYATNITENGLLVATNRLREKNGLPQLTLNPKLNLSASEKAKDMIKKNYWAHVAPDGIEPWHWFVAAGYKYVAAGENLAYGMDSSNGVVDAWFRSPSHKANLLGAYSEVGFGIKNGQGYQGTNTTLIVAHYGKQ